MVGGVGVRREAQQHAQQGAGSREVTARSRGGRGRFFLSFMSVYCYLCAIIANHTKHPD